ncbi:L,D-transpeptidase [Streptomyces ipomoeae]|uniref:L,D-transpeptidase n=1 Tax=Streptomyces ipomoeae TaxID=103232 RepID=UPI001146D5E9|nr:L,D-transpeptidase [Streptomyces ipomoeae]MDX2932345.1 L,D-transpeptidase [Streptomyces ipomoeae]TQE27047.1 murein L,D-transpeptidase [Streptomyces ipomoeae]
MSDELTQQLRELAETAATPPSVTGAEVRATAVRRRRRRRTTATVAGACAAATLAVFLTLHLTPDGTEHRRSPSASLAPTPTPTRAAPDATVDLAHRVLTVAGRELPFTAGTPRTPTPTGRMTVSAKIMSKVVSAETTGFTDDYDLKLPWVLELTPTTLDPNEDNATEDNATEGNPTGDTASGGDTREAEPTGRDATATYIAAIPYNDEAPGNYDVTTGWIGLRPTDAEWLYAQLTEGAVVDIQGPAPTPTPFPSSSEPTRSGS